MQSWPFLSHIHTLKITGYSSLASLSTTEGFQPAHLSSTLLRSDTLTTSSDTNFQSLEIKRYIWGTDMVPITLALQSVKGQNLPPWDTGPVGISRVPQFLSTGILLPSNMYVDKEKMLICSPTSLGGNQASEITKNQQLPKCEGCHFLRAVTTNKLWAEARSCCQEVSIVSETPWGRTQLVGSE